MLGSTIQTQEVVHPTSTFEIYPRCLRQLEYFNDGVAQYVDIVRQSESKNKHAVYHRLFKQALSVSTLHVYLDASHQEGIEHAGIGACIVGSGGYTLHGTRFKTTHAIKGELRAIEYGVKLLHSHLATQLYAQVVEVILYSDVVNVKPVKNTPVPWPFKAVDKSLRLIAVDVVVAFEQLRKLYPNLRYNLVYLSPRSQRYNFFYRAAHRLSRYTSNC